jgi:hypothetical protein
VDRPIALRLHGQIIMRGAICLNCIHPRDPSAWRAARLPSRVRTSRPRPPSGSPPLVAKAHPTSIGVRASSSASAGSSSSIWASFAWLSIWALSAPLLPQRLLHLAVIYSWRFGLVLQVATGFILCFRRDYLPLLHSLLLQRPSLLLPSTVVTYFSPCWSAARRFQSCLSSTLLLSILPLMVRLTRSGHFVWKLP